MARQSTIDLLSRIRRMLDGAFGPRLRGVVLFGSEARGEATPDSDIDLLVLLDGPIRLWKDSGTGIEAVYPLVLELGRPIHPMPVDIRDYEAQEFPLYRNAKREGIAA
jgi:predicted nucleotidyltransferase